MEFNLAYELPFPVLDVYATWMSSDTVIPPATKMEIAPVVGGHYRLIMETDNFTTKNEGTFSIIEPPHHVRYSWQWDQDPEITEIDVRFEESANGTIVRLTHTGFLSKQSFTNHKSGWDSYLSGLTSFLVAKLG